MHCFNWFSGALDTENGFQIGISLWVVVTNHQMPLWKKIPFCENWFTEKLQPRRSLVPLCRPTKLGSHAKGGTVLYQCLVGLVRALSPHVKRFGSFTKILEDGKMMRKVCIARRWKHSGFFLFFLQFQLRLYSNYYSFVFVFHDNYFINLSKYVAKLIGLLLPVIW